MGDWEANTDDIIRAAQAIATPARQRKPHERAAIAEVRRKNPGLDLQTLGSIFTTGKNPFPTLPPEIQGQIISSIGYRGKPLEGIEEAVEKVQGQKREAAGNFLKMRNAERHMWKAIQKAQFKADAEARVAREQRAIAEWEEGLRREAEERTVAVAAAANRAREAAKAKSRKRRGKRGTSSSPKSKTRKN